MNTRSDISDEEQLTITIRVTSVDEWEDHHSVARKVICEDISGNRIPLTIFHNNDASEFDWSIGDWYKLKNAVGNIYQGKKQLNPSYDFGIVPLDQPPEKVRGQQNTDPTSPTSVADSASADGGAVLDQRPKQGNQLLHFKMGQLPEQAVYAYRLNVPGGLDPSDEDLNRGVQGFTAKAAARFRFQADTPVTTNGPLKIYSVDKLHGELSVDGYTVHVESIGQETLDAWSFSDRKSLEDLVKQDLKATLEGRYDVRAINAIVEPHIHLEAESGDFTASRKFSCRIWVDPEGTVVCGIGISLQFESTFSAAEYVRQGYEIEGVRVTHDTDVYEKDGSGKVIQITERDYDEYDEQLGSSLAEWHSDRGRVDEGLITDLKNGEAIMAEIDYNGFEASQALNLCRIVPTLDQLKQIDPTFHKRAQDESRMLPDERYTTAQSFVNSIGQTPCLGLSPSGRPTNDCYSEIDASAGPDNLRFGNGQTASYGKVGLEKYGVHQAPESLDLLALYPERNSEESQRFLENLIGKLNEYGAEPTLIEQESYPLGSKFGYTQVGSGVSVYDCVVAIVPNRTDIPNLDSVDDPFPEFKKYFGEGKIPSQMVQVSSLNKQAYLGNIAAGVIAKTGGIPWRIHEVPGGSDVFVGLDVTYDPDTGQHLGASANIALADGTILASESVSLQQGETFDVDDVLRIMRNLIRVYVDEEGHPPDHVVIHRDGQFYLDLDDLISQLQDASDFIPKFDLVEIRKSGNPRIAEYRNGAYKVADKGIGFISENGNHSYLATTGQPELKAGNSLGTPRPIQIVKRHGSTSLDTLTEQVFWLSEAHVGSISRSTRLPITTEYADQCTEHARKGYLLNDELIRGAPYL
jgi:hypothetical protein